MYDVETRPRRLPDPLARGQRPAAGLPRQRRLGAEAAGGDRRRDARPMRRNTPTSTAACTRSRTSPPRSTRRCAARSPRFLNAASRGGDRASPPAPPRASTSSPTAGPMPRLQAGDEIVLSILEHHANIVPWHFLRERQGVVLRWVEMRRRRRPRPAGGDRRHRPADEARRRHAPVERPRHRGRREGHLRRRARAGRAGPRRRQRRRRCTCPSTCRPSAATSTRSRATSSTAPPARARSSSGPSGMAEMRPFLGGGDMIREVHRDGVTWTDPPMKFEAGTPGIVSARSASAPRSTTCRASAWTPSPRTSGPCATTRASGCRASTGCSCRARRADKAAIFSFTMEGPAHAHDISTVLDRRGIAVRAGHHCCACR